MLVLTRRVDEVVVIGGGIEVRVLGIRGNQVRIGIEAPRAVPIYRDEVHARIARELGPSPSIDDQIRAELHRRGP